MFDIRPLLKFSFWFNTTPPALQPGNERFLFGVFAIILVVGAIIRMVGTRRKEDRHVTETFNRIGRMLVSMGILGLVIFFFTFERIPFFSARIWYLLWLVFIFIWIAFIVHYIRKVVPQERQHEAEEIERKKYLPGHKGAGSRHRRGGKNK